MKHLLGYVLMDDVVGEAGERVRRDVNFDFGFVGFAELHDALGDGFEFRRGEERFGGRVGFGASNPARERFFCGALHWQLRSFAPQLHPGRKRRAALPSFLRAGRMTNAKRAFAKFNSMAKLSGWRERARHAVPLLCETAASCERAALLRNCRSLATLGMTATKPAVETSTGARGASAFSDLLFTSRGHLAKATPILMLRNRAGEAPWPVPMVCMGWPFPQLGVPQSVQSSREQIASQLFQNSVVMPL